MPLGGFSTPRPMGGAPPTPGSLGLLAKVTPRLAPIHWIDPPTETSRANRRKHLCNVAPLGRTVAVFGSAPTDSTEALRSLRPLS